MRIISVKALREFWQSHPQAEEPLKAWVDDTQQIMTELMLKQSKAYYHPVLPIKTEADYEAALAEIEKLMETAAPYSYEEDRMDVLATLVEAYEAKHYPIDPPHPIAAIEYYIESRGLSRTDFCQMLGITNGRLAELLNKRRALSTNLIRKIEEVTGIPTSVLIQPYELEQYGEK